MDGKQVRLFLVDGTSGGLITAEIMNWTGHVVVAPRSQLNQVTQRPEISRTGIYILLGEDADNPGNPQAYVGETDDVSKRLIHHARDDSKDFWNRVVVLTSKDMNLTKAHARYLESRLITLADEAGRASLMNSTAPPTIALPEADVSDMEYFISQAKIILPVLGVNVLRSTSTTPKAGEIAVPASPSTSPILVLAQDRDAVSATAQEVDGEFTVRAGSRARRDWVGTQRGYMKLRQQLEADGTLEVTDDGTAMALIKDYVFASPSAAAAVLLGRAANGRTSWKVESTGATYDHWQTSLLDTEAVDEK